MTALKFTGKISHTTLNKATARRCTGADTLENA